jgi:hypothetical protein
MGKAMAATISAEEQTALIKKYQQLASSTDNTIHYSPLQLAAHDGNAPAVIALLDCYLLLKQNILQRELSYVNNDDSGTHENILHVAIKNPDIFRICCDALKSQGFIEETILEGNMDGDTILHQAIKLGRTDVLQILMDDPSLSECLATALNKPNRHHETPIDLALRLKQTQNS